MCGGELLVVAAGDNDGGSACTGEDLGDSIADAVKRGAGDERGFAFDAACVGLGNFAGAAVHAIVRV